MLQLRNLCLFQGLGPMLVSGGLLVSPNLKLGDFLYASLGLPPVTKKVRCHCPL